MDCYIILSINMSLPFTSDNIYTTNIRAVTTGTDITIGDDSQTRNISIGTGSQGTVSIAKVTLSTDAIDTTINGSLRIGTQSTSQGITIGRSGYNTFIAGNVTLQNTPTLTCDISGTATNANNILVTRDDTSGTYYLPFVKTGGANRPLYVDDVSSALTYNPSTSTLTATNFDSSGVGMAIGTNATSVSIGKVSTPTNILGTLGVTGVANFASTVTTTGVVTQSITSNSLPMFVGYSATSIAIGGGPTGTSVTIGGGTNQGTLTIGKSGAATTINGTVTFPNTTTFSGNATTATTATNIATGSAGQIPYQTGYGTTSFIAANGATGNYLQSNGTATPTWAALPTTIATATNANNVLNAALTANQYYPLAYFNGSTASTYYQLSSDVSSNLSYNPSTKDVKVSSTVTATTFNGNLSGTADVTKKVGISTKTTGTTYPTFVDTSGNVAENINTSFIYDASNNYLTATKFIGDLSGSTTNVSIIGNDDTSGTYFLPFVKNSGSGSRPLYVDDTTGPLTYNPSTSTLTATNFSGTATRATNLASGAIGQIPYQSASGTTALLASGTSGNYLQSNGAAAPTWTAFPTTIANATNVAITDTSIAGTYYPTFVSSNSGNQGVKVDSQYLLYNAYTNTLQNPSFLVSNGTETSTTGGLIISGSGPSTKSITSTNNTGTINNNLQITTQNSANANSGIYDSRLAGSGSVNGIAPYVLPSWDLHSYFFTPVSTPSTSYSAGNYYMLGSCCNMATTVIPGDNEIVVGFQSSIGNNLGYADMFYNNDQNAASTPYILRLNSAGLLAYGSGTSGRYALGTPNPSIASTFFSVNSSGAANFASTVTTTGVVSPSMDTTGAMNIGTTNAAAITIGGGTSGTSVTIGRLGQATNILGTLGVTGAATFASTVTTTGVRSPSIDTATAGTLTIGETNATTSQSYAGALTAGSLSIAANQTTGILNIGTGPRTGLGSINIGTGTNAATINIGNATGSTGPINIGVAGTPTTITGNPLKLIINTNSGTAGQVLTSGGTGSVTWTTIPSYQSGSITLPTTGIGPFIAPFTSNFTTPPNVYLTYDGGTGATSIIIVGLAGINGGGPYTGFNYLLSSTAPSGSKLYWLATI